MTYVIAGACVADYSCVEVCPVDCIHPTPAEPGYARAEQLYIDPRACIDCGACAEVCPAETVFPLNLLPARWTGYAEVNAAHFEAGS